MATLLAGSWASPAPAQFAGSVSVTSNEIFRGDTVSGNDPAVSVALAAESATGLFAGTSASLAMGNDDPHVSYVSQYAGFALRQERLSLEAGVIHRNYDRIEETDFRKDFFEGYVGITYKAVKARAYYSPDYSRKHRASYYGEVNARLFAVEEWNVDGHAGMSIVPHESGAGRFRMRDFYDWRLQASRPIGKLFVSAGVAGTDYPVYSASGKARAFASISYAF